MLAYLPYQLLFDTLCDYEHHCPVSLIYGATSLVVLTF